jgi:hypothetical protein
MRSSPPQSRRRLALAAIAVILIPPVVLAGQTSGRDARSKPAAAKSWTAPRTVDGQPDLQGFWLVNTATPLERPKALEGRPFLTDEEVAELTKRAERIFKGGNSDFGGGDAVFNSAFNDVKQFRNPNGTETSVGMIERVFDNRTSQIVDPPDGRIPALTPAALQRQAAARAAAQRPAAGPEEMSNSYRCITTGVPKLGGLYGAGHFSYYQILQTREYVVVATETIHDARIIPLTPRPHLPPTLRQWNGDSRGRWEGNTLVVETTNFSPKSNFMGSSEHLHLVERFTRVSPDTIDFEMTISDATTWTRPWTAMVPLRRTRDRIHEFACHEGNYWIMYGMMTGARADEARATAGTGSR